MRIAKVQDFIFMVSLVKKTFPVDVLNCLGVLGVIIGLLVISVIGMRVRLIWVSRVVWVVNVLKCCDVFGLLAFLGYQLVLTA